MGLHEEMSARPDVFDDLSGLGIPGNGDALYETSGHADHLIAHDQLL
jgi:hypothetical protein